MELNIFQDLSIIHVSAWAKTFTQFRMPLLRRLRELARRQIIYCPWHEVHVSKLQEEGFEIVTGEVSQTLEFQVLPQIMQLYRFLRKNPFDILIAHQPLGSLVGITAGYLAGNPIRIYSTGGLKYSPDNQGFFNNLIWQGERVVIRMADAVFLVNREDEQWLRNDTRLAPKAFYVGPSGGCGVDATIFNAENRLRFREPARKELGIGPETLVVGYAGRCVWEKGFLEMVEAAKLLQKQSSVDRDPVFLIFGEGEDLAAIKCYAEENLRPCNFRFMGYTFNLPYYLSALDVFLLPSYREGLPISLLEALALGLSCIATDIRGSRELIQDKITGLLIPPKQPEALAKALSQLIQQPELKEALGLQAAQFVAQNYTEDILLNKTMKYLSAIIYKKLS